jgi:hypothetical protein
MMFRETGIVVAVLSNISCGDMPALALKVAERSRRRADEWRDKRGAEDSIAHED